MKLGLSLELQTRCLGEGLERGTRQLAHGHARQLGGLVFLLENLRSVVGRAAQIAVASLETARNLLALDDLCDLVDGRSMARGDELDAILAMMMQQLEIAMVERRHQVGRRVAGFAAADLAGIDHRRLEALL